jgi:hypothetical protein
MSFSDHIAQPGERHLVYGGTRAGKSSFIDWQMREISRTRPDCMQILIDTKPRFRAETEKVRWDPTGKKDGTQRGDTSTGRKVLLFPTALLSIFTHHIRFVAYGRGLVKSQSCSLAKLRNGAACLRFAWRSPERILEAGRDTSLLMRYLIFTDAILGPSTANQMFFTLQQDQAASETSVRHLAAREFSDCLF